MNILVLTRCMVHPDYKENGATNVVLFFAREWVKQGHNVVMVHNISTFPALYYKVPKFISNRFAKDGLIPTNRRGELYREEDGVRIARMPMLKFIPHSNFLPQQYKNQEKKICEYLEKLNFVPEVVTGHWFEPQLELVTALGDRYNAKKALVIHGNLPSKINSGRVAKIQQLDKLFFRSESTLNSSIQKYSFLNQSKCSVCYSGIPDQYLDNHVERNDWKEDGVLRLIYVGRLTAYKRIDVILRSLACAFPGGGYHFSVVGDGPEDANLKKLTGELGISNNVEFTGRVPRDVVISKMNHADCFVMVSENEVFGLVYLEAMASGCMTVASRNGGVDGIIRDHENGFLSEQANVDELVQLLKEINSYDGSKVAEIRKNAYETVLDFTDSKTARRYLEVITVG